MRKSRNRRTTNNLNAGFTLIEIVLSIAILAVVSLPLLRYFTDSTRYSLTETRRQKAMFLAQDITEGLLAENRLVAPNEDEDGNPILSVDYKYMVPYFDDDSNKSFNVVEGNDVLIKSGTGQAVYKTTDDGYDVKVTIETPDGVSVSEVQDVSEYGIDILTDVVHTDTTEYSQAVLEFKTLCDNDGVNTDISAIELGMSRNMDVVLSQDGDGKYRVKIYYKYTYKSTDDGISYSWPSVDSDGLLVVNKTVENLRNIYIFYDWCTVEDTVTIGEGTAGVVSALGDNKLGLNIICQQRKEDDDYLDPGTGYKLNVKSTLTLTDPVFIYTNVDNCTNNTTIPLSNDYPRGLGVGESALMFSIRTEVYPAGYDDTEDRLAVIETTKGE